MWSESALVWFPKKTNYSPKNEVGASEGIRTLDVHLGKVMLYQTELRSLPKSVVQKLGELSWIARPVFGEIKFQVADYFLAK